MLSLQGNIKCAWGEGMSFIDEMYEKRMKGCCPYCGHEIDINEFRDDLSRHEYQLSGLCQACQDEFFGGKD